MKFHELRGVILDMDGVLWRGDVALPGFADIFAWLAEKQMPYLLATNNSGKTAVQYQEKLAALGVPDVPADRILSSAIATAQWLGKRYPAGTTVYVIGMTGIREALDDSGFDVVGEGQPAELVVVGIDRDLTYAKARHAVRLIHGGAAFFGTNADKTLPDADGIGPGAGSILALIETAAGVAPTVIGKPHRAMFDAAIDALNADPAHVLMVGDRLDTDIAGAQAVGMKTALVLSGVTTPDTLASADVWPDVAYEDLAALVRAWAGDAWMTERIRARRRA